MDLKWSAIYSSAEMTRGETLGARADWTGCGMEPDTGSKFAESVIGFTEPRVVSVSSFETLIGSWEVIEDIFDSARSSCKMTFWLLKPVSPGTDCAVAEVTHLLGRNLMIGQRGVLQPRRS